MWWWLKQLGHHHEVCRVPQSSSQFASSDLAYLNHNLSLNPSQFTLFFLLGLASRFSTIFLYASPISPDLTITCTHHKISHYIMINTLQNLNTAWLVLGLARDNPLACRLDVRRTASQYTQKSIIHAKVNFYEIAIFIALVVVLRTTEVFWNVMLWLFQRSLVPPTSFYKI